MDNLTVGHSLVIVRINHLQKVHNLFFFIKNIQFLYQLSEFLLTNYPIVVFVNTLKYLCELKQEFLMLL